MKKFWIKIWEWIKTLFLGIRVLKKEDWQKLVKYADCKATNIFDLIDTDQDGIITIREIVKQCKKIKDKKGNK